jgi:pyrimidine deaminase RibD-like protein
MMNDKTSIKLVTLSGECIEVTFQRAMEVPPAVLYHFHVSDVRKKRAKRLVSVLSSWTFQVEVQRYDSLVGTVCLNAIRRALDSGIISFDSPSDLQHYQQLSLKISDFQEQPAKTEVEIRHYITEKAYWLAYRSPTQTLPDSVMLPIPFDEPADLNYLGAEADDIKRILRRLASQGLLEKVFEGNARPTEKLLSEYESVAGTGTPTSTQKNASSDDRKFASLAVEEARKSVPEADGRPHPKVGAVVVKKGRVLSSAHRGETAGNHAEFIALEKKLADDAVAGATVYTTLEPCTTRNHPKIPCARRLIERKVARVVVGMLDPDPRITGKGVLALREANIVIDLFPHDLMTEVEELNREFKRYHSQPNTSASQGAGAEEPTLPLLMKRSFQRLHQLHGKPVLTFQDGTSLQIEDTLYLDFDAGSRFIGFCVPASPRTFEICGLLAVHARQLGDELARGLSVTLKAPGENPQDINTLAYTGRVYLYHHDALTHRQVADVEDAFRKQGLNVVLRGPDYLTAAWLEWKRKNSKNL